MFSSLIFYILVYMNRTKNTHLISLFREHDFKATKGLGK